MYTDIHVVLKVFPTFFRAEFALGVWGLKSRSSRATEAAVAGEGWELQGDQHSKPWDEVAHPLHLQLCWGQEHSC